MTKISSLAGAGWMFAVIMSGCASGGSSSTTRVEPSAEPMVTSKDVDANPGVPIEKMLEAKVPGIMVSRSPDGSLSIRIRGSSSFYGATTPLFVIDGNPMPDTPGGTINGLNPYDIDTIKVLKDPADIALYGMRGANGVIVITTKTAKRR